MSRRAKRETVDRGRPFRVFVNAPDRAEIIDRAKATGMTVSSYLRAAGLGMILRPIADQQSILALIKVNADQGRVGGLLKLWLSGRSDAGVSTQEVRKLLHEIEAEQARLREIIDRLYKACK
jgi:hypothetical protein